MRLEVREVNGTVRLDVTCTNAHELLLLRRFVEMLNGGPLDKQNVASNPVFDRPIRIESVGFDANGNVESAAFEGP